MRWYGRCRQHRLRRDSRSRARTRYTYASSFQLHRSRSANGLQRGAERFLHDRLAAVGDYSSTNLALTFQHSKYNRFARWTTALEILAPSIGLVHVASFAADKSFINVDLTAERPAR